MLVLHARVNAAASVAPTIRNHTDCTRGGGSSASCQGSEYSIISLRGPLKCNGRICIILTHCSLQTKTGHETQCKSCCDRNVTSMNQEFQCNSFIHFAISNINFELYIWLCNNISNDSGATLKTQNLFCVCVSPHETTMCDQVSVFVNSGPYVYR